MTETAGASMLFKWIKETTTQYSGIIKVFSAEAAGHGEWYNTTPASLSSDNLNLGKVVVEERL